ncbi:hypothetical protein SAMN06296386_103242 [Lachnospiraceae bacterium]|nr:hypothetical protein SAMN06296386_103242 [Lachnospiraceae bacterium]
MRKIKDFELFRKNGALKQISETSKNTTADRCMVDSGIIVIDFDQAKTNYCNSLNHSEENSASADALCESISGDKYFLIEFKDGDFSTEEIRKKAADSAYIISGITCKDVNYIRTKVAFVLVYNGDAKKLSTRQKIAIAKANRGKEKYDIWGLDELCGFYFDDVLVIEKSEFEKKLLGKIKSIG